MKTRYFGYWIFLQRKSAVTSDILTSLFAACKVCPARFTQFVHLKLHTRLHTNDRPYTCGTCNKKYTSLSGLRTHRKQTKCNSGSPSPEVGFADRFTRSSSRSISPNSVEEVNNSSGSSSAESNSSAEMEETFKNNTLSDDRIVAPMELWVCESPRFGNGWLRGYWNLPYEFDLLVVCLFLFLGLIASLVNPFGVCFIINTFLLVGKFLFFLQSAAGRQFLRRY